MTEAQETEAQEEMEPVVAEPTVAGELADAEPAVVADAESAEAFVAQWRSELGGHGSISVSASEVQDRLLELWGNLPEGTVRSQVERWLTETLERHLYAVDDVQRRLETVIAAS